jgi:hypothetical protein
MLIQIEHSPSSVFVEETPHGNLYALEMMMYFVGIFVKILDYSNALFIIQLL